MQIPRKYIENYSNTLNVVSEQARRKLADALSQIDYTQDVATIRNAVIAVMQPACGASTQVAAQLAADFYDGLRVRFGVVDDFEAEPQSLRIPDATDGAVRAFAQDLVEEKPLGDFIGKCVDRIDYETRRAANECVAYNAKKDPKKPKWARVPAGAETCMWCIMLASRGFAYLSEESASHSHAHCDCRIVPSWDKKNPAVQGYDPDLYYDMWKHPEKYENAQEQKQPSFEFTPASSVKEAAQYAKDNFNCEADFSGLDVRAANALNESIAKHIDMFSELKDNFGFIGSSQKCNTLRKAAWEDFYYNQSYERLTSKGLTDSDVRAHAKRAAARAVGRAHGEWAWSYSTRPEMVDYQYRGICMNKLMWNPKEYDKQEIAVRRNVDDGFHPKGCDTVGALFDHEIGHQLDSLLSVSKSQRFRAYYDPLSKDSIKDGLSEYATWNEKEFIAEAWCEYMNNPNPREHARFVGDLIMDMYKGGGRQ